MKLANKVAIVSGGARDIGKAVSKLMSQRWLLLRRKPTATKSTCLLITPAVSLRAKPWMKWTKSSSTTYCN